MSRTPIRALIASSRCDRRDARHTDLHGQRQAFRPACRRASATIGTGVEAELRRHVRRERGLRAERREQRVVRDRLVALGVARHAELVERVADLGEVAQQRQAVGVGARVAARRRRPRRPAGSRPPRSGASEVARGARGRGPSAPRGAARPGTPRPPVASRGQPSPRGPCAGDAVIETRAPRRQALRAARRRSSAAAARTSGRRRSAPGPRAAVGVERRCAGATATTTDSAQTFESGKDALRCVDEVDAAPRRSPGSIGGASYSASVRFQIGLARCAASSEPASSHCS